MTLIPIAKIRTDGGTQPRTAIDFEAVDDYTDAMLAGTKFPPVITFYDGTDYWLADGFHRRNAAFAANLEHLDCDVRQGTREDAQWFSFSANKTNGLRRTNEDKQRAIRSALLHVKSRGLSDVQIAKHCGVAISTVGDWRKKLSATLGNLKSRTGSDGRTINTANIGRKPEPKPEQPAQAPPPPPEQTAARRPDPVGVHIVPPPSPPPPPKADPAIAAKLLRAINDLAEHEISAVELMKQLAGIPEVVVKAGQALDFLTSVCELALKREKGVA